MDLRAMAALAALWSVWQGWRLQRSLRRGRQLSRCAVAFEAAPPAAAAADAAAWLKQWTAARADAPRFDVALVLLGGNDVLRLVPPRRLENDVQSLLQALRRVASHVAWLGCADIGRAPALLPPLSWWASTQCQRRMRVIARVTAAHGVPFVDFSLARHSQRFARRPQLYFAADGLHPSAASYRECFEVLCRHVPLARWLAAPLPSSP
jgi:lysophospholipase L1-like esterase